MDNPKLVWQDNLTNNAQIDRRIIDRHISWITDMCMYRQTGRHTLRETLRQADKQVNTA